MSINMSWAPWRKSGDNEETRGSLPGVLVEKQETDG